MFIIVLVSFNGKQTQSACHRIGDVSDLLYCQAHGRDIKVETKEGEGTEFIILLSAN